MTAERFTIVGFYVVAAILVGFVELPFVALTIAAVSIIALGTYYVFGLSTDNAQRTAPVHRGWPHIICILALLLVVGVFEIVFPVRSLAAIVAGGLFAVIALVVKGARPNVRYWPLLAAGVAGLSGGFLAGVVFFVGRLIR